MPVKTVAIMSPGDMGHNVGRAFGEHGLDVITCLAGRSARTRALAEAGNFRAVDTLEELVAQADLVMSILVPAQAVAMARQIADAIVATGTDTPFTDCNAVSPQTTNTINDIITKAGGRFIDSSIIGSPPGRSAPPRFYTSGQHAGIMSELDGKGIVVKQMGGGVGRASAIKMCYAAMTKGTSALHAALLTAAHSLGVLDELEAEFSSSQADVLSRMKAQVPSLPINAGRWVGEMEQIAATFGHAGVPSKFHEGAAEMFRLLDQTPFARESPETRDRSRSMEETVEAVARILSVPAQAGD